MKRALTTILVLGMSNMLFAQSGPGDLQFQAAEQAYAKKDYKTTLIKLAEAEKLLNGSSDKILYLKIIARNNEIEAAPINDLEPIALLNTDLAKYLGDYESTDDKYRKVFQLSEKYAGYKATLKQIQDARDGSIPAMLVVGDTYSEIENYTQSMLWYKKAADRGDGWAAFKIGAMYYDGHGVKKEFKTATEWFTIAESKNIPLATIYIGYSYHDGNGVIKNQEKALSYFKAGLPGLNEWVERGDVTAIQLLESMYFEGAGVPKDHNKAFQLASKAASTGNAKSMTEVGVCYLLGYGVKKDPEKAMVWLLKSAEKGFGAAMFLLGNMYFDGYGVTKNESKAVEWLQKGTDRGHTESMVGLASMYFVGRGVPKNVEKGAEVFLKAADRGNMDALVALGNIYRDGSGLPRNYAKAKEYYERAVEEADDVAALRHLGALYHGGFGNTIDYSKALLYYNRAALKGDGVSMKRLSEMYASGKGVSKDKKLAKEWSDRAESAEIKE